MRKLDNNYYKISISLGKQQMKSKNNTAHVFKQRDTNVKQLLLYYYYYGFYQTQKNLTQLRATIEMFRYSSL